VNTSGRSALLGLALSTTLIARAASGSGLPEGSQIHTLWIGNSLTGAPYEIDQYDGGTFLPMPERLAPMLAELGITMTYDAAIQGGAKFSDHVANPATMATLADPSFDIVNLQGYREEDVNDATSIIAAVSSLYDAAHNAGSVVLLESIWQFGGFGPYELDEQGPIYPLEENAIEAASQALPDSFPVQISKCWEEIQLSTSNDFFTRLHDEQSPGVYDTQHESALGEYFNILVYARFFSGRSVADVTSMHPVVAATSTAAERQLMKQVVDGCVDIFYDPAGAPTASLTVQSPTPGQVFPNGTPVSYQGTATDSATGDLSASIEWVDQSRAVIHTGASFTQVLPAGQYAITARVTGSDSRQVSSPRSYTVASPTNQPPVTTVPTQNVSMNTPFAQLNLTAEATDPDGTIDWTSLEISTAPATFHGAAIYQDTHSAATVDVEYTGTNYSGVDHFSWRVQDNEGAWSSWTDAILNVIGASLPPARPQGLRIERPLAPVAQTLGSAASAQKTAGTGLVTGTLSTGPVTTHASGSTFLVSIARGDWSSSPNPPTDNQGNAFAQLGTTHFYNDWGSSATGLYHALLGAGGSDHTFSMSWNNRDEVTISAVEITGVTAVQAVSHVERPASSLVTSRTVHTTGPAMLVAWWWGTAGVLPVGTSHVAIPGSGFTLIPEATRLISIPGGMGYIQVAAAYRRVTDPGDYAVTWTTNNEGAQLYLVALQ
jgi:hypothetical protein